MIKVNPFVFYWFKFLNYVLSNWLKVKAEYLSPLSWKAVDRYDMLRLVTKSNVLVLKSSEAVTVTRTNVYQPLAPKGSELIFLFDGRIHQTTNGNLRMSGLNLNSGAQSYDFKYELNTLHNKFITYFIVKVIHFQTKLLLAAAKAQGLTKPKPFKSNDNLSAFHEDAPITQGMIDRMGGLGGIMENGDEPWV